MNEKLNKSLEVAAEKYSNLSTLRATIQAIPYMGGPIDTLLAGRGSKIQLARIEHMFEELSNRLDGIKSVPPYNEEQLYDIVMTAMDKAVRTRASEKRAIFSNIIFKQVIEGKDIEESEMALRIVADLELIHLKIIAEALLAPPCGEPFKGLRVLSINERRRGVFEATEPIVLTERLPRYSVSVLRHACSELVSQGLLYDEGVGRLDTKSMQFLVPTDTAAWLEKWLLI